ncbi:MAG: hypothetical protein KGH53_02765 [Candidatus Micrarchaeota archaeon]|nr:hypothetical protein [Candidatus Micrarchaeota archaeon]
MFALFYIVLLTLISALMIAFAQYNFKREMPKFHITKEGMISIISNGKIQIGLVLYVVALGIYLVALSLGELSLVYPIFASVFLFVMLISHRMLKELVSPVRALGVVLIIAGIVLTAMTFSGG